MAQQTLHVFLSCLYPVVYDAACVCVWQIYLFPQSTSSALRMFRVCCSANSHTLLLFSCFHSENDNIEVATS